MNRIWIFFIITIAIIGTGTAAKYTVMSDKVMPENSQNTINIDNSTVKSNQTASEPTVVKKPNKKLKHAKTVNKTHNDDKYEITVCKRCGKSFKQPKEGPGYYYCEECMNSPEIQEMIEKETAGAP